MQILFYSAALLTFISTAASADVCTSSENIVNNCGFETGTLAGWSLSGTQSSPGYLGISYGVDASDAHSGNYGAYLGGYGGYLSLSQTILTTPGVSYEISYYLAQAPATPTPYTSGFDTEFNGTLLFQAGNAPLLPFRLYSFDAEASSTQSLLTFSARDDTGYFSLDDVSVTPVPEPVTCILTLPVMYLLLRRICCCARGLSRIMWINGENRWISLPVARDLRP